MNLDSFPYKTSCYTVNQNFIMRGLTSDHTIVRSNQIPDPVFLVWEHTASVGFCLVRGHFQMAPQPGCH